MTAYPKERTFRVEAHTLETVLAPSDKKNLVIDGIKAIADDIIPTDNLRFYS